MLYSQGHWTAANMIYTRGLLEQAAQAKPPRAAPKLEFLLEPEVRAAFEKNANTARANAREL